MSDDIHKPADPHADNSDENNEGVAPSTLFLEMMRRAAERREKQANAADDEAPSTPQPAASVDDSNTEAPPPDMSSVDDNQVDDITQPEPAADEPTTDDTSESSKPRLKKRYSLPDFPPAAPVPDEPDFLSIMDDEMNAAQLASSEDDRSSDADGTADGSAADASDDEAVETTEDAVPVPMPRVPIYEPPTMSDEERQQKLEAQRVRRVRRRKARRHERNVGIFGGFMRTVFITIFTAGLVSTIFTWFTKPEFIRQDVVSGLQLSQVTATPLAAAAVAETPTSMPTPNWLRRIGVVSGHRGPEGDPGAVTSDGLTEAEINFGVATELVRLLRQQGYTVDLLDEFDPRLDNYKASALISLHANNCDACDESISGFLVSKAAARPEGGIDTALAECIAQSYGETTGIPRQFNLTVDMTDYHTFREIHPETPAAILELGYMVGDRNWLTERQPELAGALVDGVECFFELERAPSRRTGVITPNTPTPTVTPPSSE